MFSNNNASFVLKNSASEIRMTPNTVVGWNDRSLIKNTVGGGLGDYNLVSYAPTLNNNIVNYAAAPAELVYDNSNAVVGLTVTARTNSNALVYLRRTTSNSEAYLSRMSSNSIAYLSRTSSNSIAYLSRMTSNSIAWLSGVERGNSNFLRITSNALVYLNRTTSNSMAYLSRMSSNSIAYLSRTSSNSIAYLSRMTSNSIAWLSGVERGNSNFLRITSNALVYLNRTTSNSMAYLSRMSSNSIAYLSRTSSNSIAYLSRMTSNSIAWLSGVERGNSNFLRVTSNALVYLRRTTSNSEAYLSRMSSNSIAYLSRTSSNSIAYLSRMTSNSIAWLSGVERGNSNLLRVTSNGLVYLRRTTSNSEAYLSRMSSNSIAYLSRTTSNSIAYLSRMTSNSIAWLSGVERGNSNLLRVTSNAANYLSMRVRTDSNALMSWARQTSNSMNYWAPVIRGNSNFLRVTSNALTYLNRTTSNSIAWLYGIERGNSNLLRVTSNGLAYLNRTTSNSMAYLSRMSSNSIAYLSRTSSNSIAYLSRMTSNSIAWLSGVERGNSNLLRVTSNGLVYLRRTTSNSEAYLSRMSSNSIAYLSRTSSNSIAYLSRMTSNSIAWLSGVERGNSNLLRVTSNALVYLNRTTSNSMAYLSRMSSNSIAYLSRTSSNSIAYLSRMTSNSIAWLSGVERGNSNLLRVTSNALVYLRRTTSNSEAYLSRMSSNSIAYLSRTSSNSIAYLSRMTSNSIAWLSGVERGNSNLLRVTSNAANYLSTRVRTDSNALLYGIKNNSNALLFGIRNNSNAIIYLNQITGELSIHNSNAIVSWIKQTSNAAVYLNKRVINNSNAIVKLATNIQIFGTQQIYSTNTTIDALAWYKNGFAIYPDITFALRTPLEVSGQISLAGTLTLSNDLFMDSGTTLSSSFGFGHILGNGKALHLNGDFSIPDGNILHIGNDTTIEGNGNSLTLGNDSKIMVDTGATLTLRNLIFRNTSNGSADQSIQLASLSSKLVLDSVNFDLADNFWLNRGQMYVYNDMNVTGSSSFVYSSAAQSYIMSGGSLIFNPGTIFDYQPCTTGAIGLAGSSLLTLDDATSKIYLNGCTLQTTQTGFRLTKGQLIFDNEVSVSSQIASIVSPNSTTGGLSDVFTGGQIGAFLYAAWSADGRYAVVNTGSGLQTYRFTATSGTGGLSVIGSGQMAYPLSSISQIKWSPDGRYMAVIGVGLSGSTGVIKAYKFIGSGNQGGLQEVASGMINYLSAITSIDWSPDSQYVVVGVADNSDGSYKVKTFRFICAGNSGGFEDDFAGNVNLGLNANVGFVSWSCDGTSIAVAFIDPNDHSQTDLKAFKFTGLSLNGGLAEIGSGFTAFIQSTFDTSGAQWSPDGKKVLMHALSALKVYNFTGGGNAGGFAELGTGYMPIFTGELLEPAGWTPDGRYVVVGWAFANLTKVYKVTGVGPSGGLEEVGTSGSGLPGSKAALSPDGKYVLCIDQSPGYPNYVLKAYAVNWGADSQQQPFSSSIILGNSSLGLSEDLNVKLLSGANVSISGLMNYDNTLGYTMFSNDDARFVLANSNSKIRMTPNTVIGWQDRSLIKNITGAGLGDYNLQTYSSGNNIVTYDQAPGELVYDNSNAINFERDHFISVNNGTLTVLGAITGSTNVKGESMSSGPIDLQGGTLTLGSDMTLASQTTVVSSGNFDLQGNAMIFGGDLTLPTNIAITVVSGGVLDGQNNDLSFASGARLVVDTGVTLTLRNLNLLAAGSTPIEMRDETCKLTLQNMSTSFDIDYAFTQGQLFVQDDVFVTGTNQFSYASTGTSYIALHSTLYFDKNTTFSYSPGLTRRHTLSERNLIKMADQTSGIYFDQCTVQLPDSGWQLINGSVYFNNKVTVNGNTTQATSFELGNGLVGGDMNVQLLSGAWLDNLGYIYYNPSY